MKFKNLVKTFLASFIGCTSLQGPSLVLANTTQEEKEEDFQPEAVGPLQFDPTFFEKETSEVEPFSGWKNGSYYKDNQIQSGSQTIYGVTFLLDENGKPKKGLINNRYYSPQTGALYQDCLLQIQSQLYQADEEGILHVVNQSLERTTLDDEIQAVILTENSSLNGPSASLDQCVVISASNSNGKIDGFETKVEEALKNNQLVVLKHDFLGQESNPEQEAHQFYLSIQNYVGKALPLLSFELNTKETGLSYLHRFLDAFTVLSNVKPFLYVPKGMMHELDFDKFTNLYPMTNSLTSFPLNESSFLQQIKPTPSSVLEYMYRLYNPNSGEHFYTSSINERDTLVTYGWEYEHLGWIASKNGRPVYRIYNPNAGDHHYTLDENERFTLIRLGWIDEEIGWYSSNDKAQPVYRAYNPNALAGSHHFTTDGLEIRNLVKLGWSDEEIAWYGTNSDLKALNLPKVPYINDGYCFNENGVKLDEIQKVEDKLYYFNPEKSGKLETGKEGITNIGKGRIVCFQNDGSLYTGGYTIDEKLYWFLPEVGYAATNEFLLIPANYNNGMTDFVWFNANGIGEDRQPDCKTEAKRQYWRGKNSWFIDSKTGASIPCREYFDQQYGTSRLNQFMAEALLYEGTPYVWAGKGPATGFDCSGLVTWCMNQKWLIDVQPFYVNALGIYMNYCDPLEKGEEKPGDIVFWRGTYGSDPNYVSHVGVYVGNGWTFCAGDPLGFYPIDATLRPDGSIAPSFFGRISDHHYDGNPPTLTLDGRPKK